MWRGDRGEAVELRSPDSHGDKLITKIRATHTISHELHTDSDWHTAVRASHSSVRRKEREERKRMRGS